MNVLLVLMISMFAAQPTADTSSDDQLKQELNYVLDWEIDETPISSYVEMDILCTSLLEKKKDINDNVQAAILLRRGMARLKQKKYKDALDDFKVVLTIRPGDIDARRGRIIAAYPSGEATLPETFHQATMLKAECPNDARVINMLGAVEMELKHYDKAIEYFSQAIERDELYVSAYLNRAFCYYSTGQPELFLKDTDMAARIAPSQTFSSRN